ncbi:hypothetical protein [uncultured Cohaesibacter sp.]|uniref:hypothetical protein n=1 Tax=uncultured Cohaesibacter sp. TaxID=1002546 RepID=UPI0029C90E6E|nr:hypothetical protein [uncultured Cohaesibacter sp.]
MSFTEQQTTLIERVTAVAEALETAQAEIETGVSEALEKLTGTATAFYVDPTDGDDDNDGSNWSKAFLTLDAALAQAVDVYSASIYIGGNVALERRHYGTLTNLSLYGRVPDSTTGKDILITVSGEAINSPDTSGGQVAPGVQASGKFSAQSSRVSFSLAGDALTGFTIKTIFHGLGGIDYIFRTGEISIAEAGAGVDFLGCFRPAPISFFVSDFTLGSNAAGCIMQDVSAGSDPNADARFRSNLTSL